MAKWARPPEYKPIYALLPSRTANRADHVYAGSDHLRIDADARSPIYLRIHALQTGTLTEANLELFMIDFLRFRWNRIREKLWVRPLLMCIISLAAVLLAKTIEFTPLSEHLPVISIDAIEALLTILTAGMLVIATFAVGSMVAAYTSAGNTATPRTFPLMISDDVSQNALSTFIGAFIFSVVAVVFQKHGYYGQGGRFVLFVLTCFVFVIVIMTFVYWVDRIARLGRLSQTIDKVEAVTSRALRRRRNAPTMGGQLFDTLPTDALPVYSQRFGYVQRINIDSLQKLAKDADATIYVAAQPGAFIVPGRPIAHVLHNPSDPDKLDINCLQQAFLIDDDRTFDNDPRFGLIVLSEIAGKALSPAVNDPGTAIDVVGSFVRLFAEWAKPAKNGKPPACHYDRVFIPAISVHDMFDDAFWSLARDGAGSVEVMSRLLKALASFTTLDDPHMKEAAIRHTQLVRQRAERAMSQDEDLAIIRELSRFTESG